MVRLVLRLDSEKKGIIPYMAFKIPDGATPVERVSLMANPSVPCVALHLARYTWATRIINLYSPHTVPTVLDIACGTGYGTNLLSSIPAYALGVDISGEAIQEAHDHHSISEHKDGNVAFINNSFESYMNAQLAQSVDFVVCFETLEHVDDMQAAINHILRVYRIGALICVPLGEAVNSWPYHKTFEITNKKISDMIPEDHLLIWYSQRPQPFCEVMDTYDSSQSNLLAMITRRTKASESLQDEFVDSLLG